MTSLFDQFEQASIKTKKNYLTTAELSNLGYINITLNNEIPIFTKSKKDFTPPDKITHVAIANKSMILAMSNNILFRMNMNTPKEKNQIPLNKYTQNKLGNIFLDPTGSHALLTFTPKNPKVDTSEFMYLSSKADKLKSTAKFRGHEITAVAWCHTNQSDNYTGPILLGTSKGLIFETDIVAEGDKFFSSGLEQYWKQVFDLGRNTDTPTITSLEYFQISGTDKYVIFATTPAKLYYFIGRSDGDSKTILQQIFHKYYNVPEAEVIIALEENVKHSKIQFWSENLITPNMFVWITDNHIYFEEIDLQKSNDLYTLQQNIKQLEYPKQIYEENSLNVSQYPIAFAITQFHILLAYSDTIKGMCLLNQEVVYEDQYNEAFGKLISLVKDNTTGDIWAMTENAMFRFKVHKEERNIWPIFCANKQFDLAKKYSIGNEACYNQVLIKEAEMLFQEKKYKLSAERYAETQSPFEEICLKFMQINQSDALKIFLRNKLSTLKPQDKTQITMIVIWVIELYLTKLELKRLENLEKSAAYDDIQTEFETFISLPEVSDCIKNNKRTIYELMQNHGDKSNLIKLTVLNKDFEQLIRQHIFKNNFHEALEVLKNQTNAELHYQFAPILIQEIPKHVVRTLIEQGKKLNPLRLLPALVNCDGELHSLEIIRYLEFCVVKLKNTDKAIHNFLLSLYGKHDPKKLKDYLLSQGQELSLINYDVNFALRLCTEHNLIEACVHLSGLLGLWESAVDLGLKVDLELAKKMVNLAPENDIDLKKKLWLKIAKHVVSEKDDIKEAMTFLQNCDLIKIEDILPFFSDFVTIDHFKDAICNSLKEYNQYIQTLKDDMEEATKSAEQVRNEINSFRNCYMTVNSNDSCEICSVTLMIRPFYLFPCHHKFHSDCLVKTLSPYLSLVKKNRLAELERHLKALDVQSAMDNVSTSSTGVTARDQVKNEIDNIIASECLYCGESMIKNIDTPFIDDNDYDNVLKEWE